MWENADLNPVHHSTQIGKAMSLGGLWVFETKTPNAVRRRFAALFPKTQEVGVIFGRTLHNRGNFGLVGGLWHIQY